MKPYKVTMNVTSQWIIKICAEDETEACQVVEDMTLEDIACGGDFQSVISVEAIDVERVSGPEDEE